MIQFACNVRRRDGVHVRVEVDAACRVSAIRAALRNYPGASASCRPLVPQSSIVLDDLGVRMSPFPLTVKS